MSSNEIRTVAPKSLQIGSKSPQSFFTTIIKHFHHYPYS